MQNIWVFVKKDGSTIRVESDEDVPTVGDGKVHDGTGYRVVHKISGISGVTVIICAES